QADSAPVSHLNQDLTLLIIGWAWIATTGILGVFGRRRKKKRPGRHMLTALATRLLSGETISDRQARRKKNLPGIWDEEQANRGEFSGDSGSPTRPQEKSGSPPWVRK